MATDSASNQSKHITFTYVCSPLDPPLPPPEIQRILALDGGGVRGLSSLLILREIMNDIGENVKPREYFDLIGGTSTGGLIAIMLGILGMVQLAFKSC